ncbi:MAG TPA: hypothetical protein VNF51_02780 [Candidatus Paceibacterota bacterium]|nr:hypothetical protein [Candidatus Paceibacterota bacterium]
MSIEKQSAYDALPSEHELVSHYQPRFIARGGDHLVYEASEHPDVVIKASTYKIKDILIDNETRGLPLDDVSDEMYASLDKEIAEKNTQIQEYRKYFGAKHTLAERRYLMQVPVSTEVLREIFKNDWEGRAAPPGVASIQDAWSAVVVQKRARQIEDPNHVGLYFGGFLEERGYDLSPSEYGHFSEVFEHGDAIQPEDLEEFFRLQDNPDTHALRDLVLRTEQDPELKKSTIDFLQTAIRFANETGNILALAGKDNVILYPGNSGWNYVLIDAIPLPNEPILTAARAARGRSKNNELLNQKEEGYIIRARNFVRTINGLAAALGVEERIRF